MTYVELVVVMPVFNAGATVAACIESILAQTFSRFELLVIDDGSVDQTPEILDRFAQQDDRVRVVRHQSNQGFVAAIATGLSSSSAPLVARIDADDTCHPTRFEQQVDAFRSDPRLSLCWTGFELIRDGVSTSVTPPTSHGAMLVRLLRSNRIVHSSVMMRRQEVVRVGGYRGEWYPADDYDLWCRLLASGRGRGLPEPLVVINWTPGGISSSSATSQLRLAAQIARRERLRVLERSSDGRPTAFGQVRYTRAYCRAVEVDMRSRDLDTGGLAEMAFREMMVAAGERALAVRLLLVALAAPIASLRHLLDAGRRRLRRSVDLSVQR